MKRVYLIGAVLLLLCLFIGGYFFNAYRDAQNSSKTAAAAATHPALVCPPPVAVDNAPQAPVVTDEPIATTASYTGNYPRSHRSKGTRKTKTVATRTRKSKAPVEITYASATENVIVAEKTHEFTGNVPKKEPVATRTIVRRKAPTAYASTPNPFGTITFGPEFGGNTNGFSGNNTSNIHTSSFFAGVNVNVRLGDHIAVQPGVRYINRGNRTMGTMDVDTKEKLSIHYIEMPVNLVAKLGDVQNTRILVGAGPYAAYRVGARHQFSSSSANGDGFADVLQPETPKYNTGSVPRMDYGVGAFVGAETPEGIYAKVGFEQGLRQVQKNDNGTKTDRPYSFLFSVGYMIGGYRK